MDKRFWLSLVAFLTAVVALLVAVGVYVRKHGCPICGIEGEDDFDFDFDDYDCDCDDCADCGEYCGACVVEEDAPEEQAYTAQEAVVIEEAEKPADPEV